MVAEESQGPSEYDTCAVSLIDELWVISLSTWGTEERFVSIVI
jgi:hypothetical protein